MYVQLLIAPLTLPVVAGSFRWVPLPSVVDSSEAAGPTDLQLCAVWAAAAARCSCRRIQHFGQHLYQLSSLWTCRAALSQAGTEDFAVGNVTTFSTKVQEGKSSGEGRNTSD